MSILYGTSGPAETSVKLFRSNSTSATRNKSRNVCGTQTLSIISSEKTSRQSDYSFTAALEVPRLTMCLETSSSTTCMSSARRGLLESARRIASLVSYMSHTSMPISTRRLLSTGRKQGVKKRLRRFSQRQSSLDQGLCTVRKISYSIIWPVRLALHQPCPFSYAVAVWPILWNFNGGQTKIRPVWVKHPSVSHISGIK